MSVARENFRAREDQGRVQTIKGPDFPIIFLVVDLKKRSLELTRRLDWDVYIYHKYVGLNYLAV